MNRCRSFTMKRAGPCHTHHGSGPVYPETASTPFETSCRWGQWGVKWNHWSSISQQIFLSAFRRKFICHCLLNCTLVLRAGMLVFVTQPCWFWKKILRFPLVCQVFVNVCLRTVFVQHINTCVDINLRCPLRSMAVVTGDSTSSARQQDRWWSGA